MWHFLSRSYGETEGYSAGSMAEFKGNPLQALARETCQNSLDAADGSGRPVIVEFECQYVPISSFPGMDELRPVFTACSNFWKKKKDINTSTFLNKASDCFRSQNGKFYVLRVSDYNTTGVSGAFSDEDITPWGGLVKGNAFSVKTDTSNAAGSYGIGKAAPFVSSAFQTVFYRTLDSENVKAALGVARLMAHEATHQIPEGEDPVRRSVGYYGADVKGKPQASFAGLDALNIRTQQGTDLFIPGFTGATSDDSWVKDILKEIVDNFLYSIYSGKLEIHIQNRTLTRKNLRDMLDFIGSKDAKIFYDVISDNDDVIEETFQFHDLGTLRLRLLYGNDLNKKILVVRNSGMRIAKIPALPRMISYTGFLELQGPGINQFFRTMENPKHNAWEPKRHGNPAKAKQYKEEVESWVIETITKKLIEQSGDESIINVGDCFNFDDTSDNPSEKRKYEHILDETEQVNTSTYIPQKPASGMLSIRDEGRANRTEKRRGFEDPAGEKVGHRHRTGTKTGGQPTGRKVRPDDEGNDSFNVGAGGDPHEVDVSVRIISHGKGTHRLFFTAKENITLGRMEIVTKGENGKSLKLFVSDASGETSCAENGHIVIRDIIANTKYTVDFRLEEERSYAMGVKAYGN